jgi:hypothetical protein
VSSESLESRRTVGRPAYGLFEEAEATVGGDRGTQLFRLCAWNAFALQTIADSLLDADTAADPATVGYVPRSTFGFAQACLNEVPDWLGLAHAIQSDPDPRISARLPARLPGWERDEPTRASELRGLQDAFEDLQARTETKVLGLTDADPARAELRHLCEQMKADAENAADLGVRGAGPVERGMARSHLLYALQHAFTLGQLLAVPTLVEVERVAEDHAEDLPLSSLPSWLQIGPGWAVVDAGGRLVGTVVRVRGDRATGAFEGLDISAGIETAGRQVAPEEIAAIRRGEIQLRA